MQKEIPDDAVFCQHCGTKQGVSHRPKTRGNAQGSVYKLPNGTFRAVVTLGYTVDADGKKHRKVRAKEGFKTKKAALDYLPQLRLVREKPKTITLQQLYERWLPTHRAGKDTINCYKAAAKYFQPLWHVQLSEIDIDDLQDCMDECPRGKRTHENMKALCGLLYKYAIPRGLASLNLGQYLIVDAAAGAGKVGLPLDALEKLKKPSDPSPTLTISWPSAIWVSAPPSFYRWTCATTIPSTGHLSAAPRQTPAATALSPCRLRSNPP